MDADEPRARPPQLEYESVDPALLQSDPVDFLDDASSGAPLLTLEFSEAPRPVSGHSSGGQGGGGDGAGGMGEVVGGGGQRRKDMSSLFVGIEDNAGDDWLRLAKRQ